MTSSLKKVFVALFLFTTLAIGLVRPAVAQTPPEEVRAIAKEAYLYGFPMVEAYKTLYQQAVDVGGPNFRAPFNQLANTAQVFTPEDTAIITPNSDTPYSFLWMDLRAEPVVITVPKIDPKRYFRVQLIDMYTQNFAYIGDADTNGGSYLIAGPAWTGDKPKGVDLVIKSETEFAYALYRTQLFGPGDIDAVKALQAQYKVQTLSAFLGTPAPGPAPIVDWPKLDLKTMTTTPEIFTYMNFLMQFTPPDPSETATLAKFAEIGIGAGKPLDVTKLDPATLKAMEDGIAEAIAEFATFKKEELDTRKVGSGAMFGSRAFLKNNYLYRYGAAKLGIFGNSIDEADYHGYFVDGKGAPLDAATNNYELTFAKGQLPPAKAFWSLTMYDGKSQLLVANPLNRYLINSPMLPDLKMNADGSLTLYIQHDAPEDAKQSNWLPAPAGPFYGILRLYEPGEADIDGTWKVPPMVKAK